MRGDLRPRGRRRDRRCGGTPLDGPSPEEDVRRELRTHLALREEELVTRGWSRSKARAEALRAFGDVEAVERECARIARRHERAERRGRMMEGIVQDVRYGIRSLTGSPGFTAVALLTLALGIGANTAIFSVVDGVLLEPLPWEEPHELVWIDETRVDGGSMSVAWPNYEDWRRITTPGSAEGIAAFGFRTPTVLGGPEPVRIEGAVVTGDFWRVLPVAPLAGRLTLPDDHREGAGPVLVVARSLARDALGATDPAEAVGRTLDVGGTTFQVVGVVPDAFDFPAGSRHWSPAERTGGNSSRTSHNWSVVGRLADGVTAGALAEPLNALQARLAEDVPPEDLEYMAVGVNVIPLHEQVVGDVRTPLLILLGAAGFVLLVACTNLASTLLARGTARARELAVRSALGGTRRRLVRQLLTESLLLALGGAAAGMGLAAATLGVLRRLGGGAVPRLDAVALDGRVLAFTLGAAVLTALAFGLLPALRSSGEARAQALKAGGRGGIGRHGRTWSALVAAEVALALVLLAGSGLLVRSFVAVLDEDPGFDAVDVTTAELTPGPARYPESADHARFWDALLERVEELPGTAAAGLISPRPLSSFPTGRLALDGDPGKFGNAGYVVASAGAFEALDIPLLRGRLFDEGDGPDAPHVVVVSRSFVEEYWPDENPLGRTVTGGGMDEWWDADPPVWGTVVGVVEDVRFRGLERSAGPTVYWHHRQRPSRIRWGATLVAESATGDPSLLAGPVRTAVREADPDIPVRIRHLGAVRAESMAERRFILFVLGGFSLLGLLLAAAGIYGVVSYSVARRTREMGVRLALGADPGSVRNRVLRDALRPVVVGLVLGVTGAGLLVGALRGLPELLYRVEPNDPATWVGVTLLLLAVGVGASWLPARRGTRVDPMVTMRAE